MGFVEEFVKETAKITAQIVVVGTIFAVGTALGGPGVGAIAAEVTSELIG